MKIFFYNSLSNKKNKNIHEKLKLRFSEYQSYDVINTDLKKIIDNLCYDDEVVIAGGDGTLNHFVNYINGSEIKAKIYLCMNGTGNDFYKSLDTKEDIVFLNDYIKNLPTVKVLNNEYRFLNNCGLGLDGYVCHLVELSKKKSCFSFYKAAIKGFFTFKRRCASMLIDNKKYEFKKVYLASILEGKYCGGGMMMAPNAIRCDNKLDICVIYNMSRLKILFLFKSIYKGKHIKYNKNVFYAQGTNISLEFDKGTYFQMDGETMENINKIDVQSNI